MDIYFIGFENIDFFEMFYFIYDNSPLIPSGACSPLIPSGSCFPLIPSVWGGGEEGGGHGFKM